MIASNYSIFSLIWDLSRSLLIEFRQCGYGAEIIMTYCQHLRHPIFLLKPCITNMNDFCGLCCGPYLHCEVPCSPGDSICSQMMHDDLAHGPRSVWLDTIELSWDLGMVMFENAHICFCHQVCGHHHWDAQLWSDLKACLSTCYCH